MRLLLITTHTLPLLAGAPRVYDALARAFDGDMSVLTAKSDYLNGNTAIAGAAVYDAAAPYPITRIKTMTTSLDTKGSWLQSLSRGIDIISAIRKQVRKDKSDAFIIGSAHRLGWLVPVLKTLFQKPVFLYLHGEEVQTQLMRGLDRRFDYARQADGVFVVSRFTAKLAHDMGFTRHQICLVPNAVDNSLVELAPHGRDWRQELGISADVPLVVSVGRFIERKGFDRLIEAWVDVEKELPEAYLILLGGGELKPKLVAHIAEANLAHVAIFEQVPDPDLASLYQAADVFVLANRTLDDGDTEGFGLVFLEAGLFGVPSIGGAAGGVPDAIIDGETGLLVDAEKPENVSAALLDFLKNGGKRNRMGLAAKEHAEMQRWNDKAQQVRAFIRGFLR